MVLSASFAEDLRRDIDQIEARIEGLRDKVQICRTAMRLSKMASGAGALGFAATLTGVVPADATILVFSIAAMIGGVVWLGANQSSLKGALEELHADEQVRADLIDQIPFGEYRPMRDNAVQNEGVSGSNRETGFPER
jgi:hypothetical protein